MWSGAAAARPHAWFAEHGRMKRRRNTRTGRTTLGPIRGMRTSVRMAGGSLAEDGGSQEPTALVSHRPRTYRSPRRTYRSSRRGRRRGRCPRGARRTHRAVLHSRRVERHPPASVVVLSELEIVALAAHPDSHVTDPTSRARCATHAPSHVSNMNRVKGRSHSLWADRTVTGRHSPGVLSPIPAKILKSLSIRPAATKMQTLRTRGGGHSMRRGEHSSVRSIRPLLPQRSIRVRVRRGAARRGARRDDPCGDDGGIPCSV